MARAPAADLYHGRTGTRDEQQAVRDRVHWICRHANGETLVVGCGEGLTCVLLARDGTRVHGIDRDATAIDAGRAGLESEEASVRELISLRLWEGSELPFGPACLDTVVVEAGIDHLLTPERLMSDVHRVLRPAGLTLLVSRYGVADHRDHLDAFLLGALPRMLAVGFGMRHIDLLGEQVMVMAERDGPGDGALHGRLLTIADERVARLDRDLATARAALAEAARTSADRDRLRAEIEQARARIAELERAYAALNDRALVRVARRLTRQHARTDDDAAPEPGPAD